VQFEPQNNILFIKLLSFSTEVGIRILKFYVTCDLMNNVDCVLDGVASLEDDPRTNVNEARSGPTHLNSQLAGQNDRVVPPAGFSHW